MDCLEPKDYLTSFVKLTNRLSGYYTHEKVAYPDIFAIPEAFNILIVLANKRDAMLFQSVGDAREENKEKVDQQQKHLELLGNHLKRMINFDFGLPNFNILVDTCGIYIYHSRIQHEVDARYKTKTMTDILRYLSPFQPENWDYMVSFKYNGHSFLSFGCIDSNLMFIEELKKRLEDYKFVANETGGKMQMLLKFQ